MRLESSASQEVVCDLFQYLVARVKELVANAVPPEPATPFNESYNPPKLGRFYYFSPGCEQIRQTRLFAKDAGRAKDRVYDEQPSDNACNKQYGKVRGSSPAYMMFFFCPSHGHCYGGHIIDGKEGRKDPSCAIYTHKKNAPSVVIYDFACSLEEYNLNRESGYWLNTRMFMDIFHGYNHVCSPAFKMNKALYGLTGVNTSICEQFNAYIKRIKSSAEHMTQTKFVFYIQYFMHLWNVDKSNKVIETAEKSLRASVRM
jgi:hypothetical protein